VRVVFGAYLCGYTLQYTNNKVALLNGPIKFWIFHEFRRYQPHTHIYFNRNENKYVPVINLHNKCIMHKDYSLFQLKRKTK